MPADKPKSQFSRTETIVLSVFIILVGTGGVGYVVSQSIVTCILAPLIFVGLFGLVLWGKLHQSAPSFLQNFSQLVFERKTIPALVAVAMILGTGVGIKAYNEKQDQAEQQKIAAATTEKQTIQKAEEEKAAAEKKTAALAQLREDAPKQAEQFARQIDQISAQIEEGKCRTSDKELAQIKDRLSVFNDIKPLPEEIAALKTKLEALHEPVAQCQKEQQNALAIKKAREVVDNPEHCKVVEILKNTCERLQTISPDDVPVHDNLGSVFHVESGGVD